MTAWKTGALLGLALAAGLGRPGTAAGEHHHCPKPSYSPVHYWAPTLYRVYACFHGPQVPLVAPVRCLPVGGNGRIVRYPCPPVDPAHYDSPYAGPLNEPKSAAGQPDTAEKAPPPTPAK